MAYLYRAADQYGQLIDVLLPARRDLTAARRCFTRALYTDMGPRPRSRPTALPCIHESSIKWPPSL